MKNLKTENKKLAKMLEELSVEKVDVARDSEKFSAIVKKHGFERVRTDESGSFVVKDSDTQRYFLVESNREYSEIAKP